MGIEFILWDGFEYSVFVVDIELSKILFRL